MYKVSDIKNIAPTREGETFDVSVKGSMMWFDNHIIDTIKRLYKIKPRISRILVEDILYEYYDLYRLSAIVDSFEAGVGSQLWETIKGGDYDPYQIKYITMGLLRDGEVPYFADSRMNPTIMCEMFHRNWNISRNEAVRISRDWDRPYWKGLEL